MIDAFKKKKHAAAPARNPSRPSAVAAVFQECEPSASVYLITCRARFRRHAAFLTHHVRRKNSRGWRNAFSARRHVHYCGPVRLLEIRTSQLCSRTVPAKQNDTCRVYSNNSVVQTNSSSATKTPILYHRQSFVTRTMFSSTRRRLQPKKKLPNSGCA